MRRLVLLLLAIAVIVIGLSFATLNAKPVALNYYLATAEMPLSLWLAITLLVGAVLGALSTLAVIMRQRRQLVRLRRESRKTREELDELRKLPVREQP